LHLAQCSQASTALKATSKPRHFHQIATQRSVIHHFREHVSTGLESSDSMLSWRLLCTVHFTLL
ncbi:unnamed protein product, partial [Staurois parvus]